MSHGTSTGRRHSMPSSSRALGQLWTTVEGILILLYIIVPPLFPFLFWYYAA